MKQVAPQAHAAAEWFFGESAEFLELSEGEQKLVALRTRLCQAIRRNRERQGLTQKQLADKMQSSQSRVAKMESGVGASLDLMFKALFELGGDIAEINRAKDSAPGVNRAAEPGSIVRK